MEIIIQTEKWLACEFFQSKIMVIYGLMMLLVSVILFRTSNEFLKGAIIPIILLGVLFCFYGGNVIINYPKKQDNFQSSYKLDKNRFITVEKQRMEKLIQTYTFTKIMWLSFIIIGISISLFMKSSYISGLGFGLIILATSSFIADTLFEHFAENYQCVLNKNI